MLPRNVCCSGLSDITQIPASLHGGAWWCPSDHTLRTISWNTLHQHRAMISPSCTWQTFQGTDLFLDICLLTSSNCALQYKRFPLTPSRQSPTSVNAREEKAWSGFISEIKNQLCSPTNCSMILPRQKDSLLHRYQGSNRLGKPNSHSVQLYPEREITN